jgi:transcriptional regulator with XRE-family HTH domain
MEPRTTEDPDDRSLSDDLLARAERVVRERIRELRGQEGLSQAEAARRLGHGQWYWSRLESGAVELRLDHLLEVQAALGLDSIEALFGVLPSEQVTRGIAADEGAEDTVEEGLGA